VHISRLGARPLAVLSGVIVAILVLVLVALSPFALREIARLPGMNWVRLSNVGQTYGGISALLAALALVGVVISLLYQARDVGIAREQARRTIHNELLRMELEDPIYMEALGAPWGIRIATDYDSLRQFSFIHMWVSFWQGRYLLNEMSETQLRAGATFELFNSKAGRDFWLASRARWMTGSSRDLKFAKILDEEYQKALAKGDPGGMSLPRKAAATVNRSSREMQFAKKGIILGVAAGVAMGFLMGRKKAL
jgi:hypothetical protein